jgi:hypothetical protein
MEDLPSGCTDHWMRGSAEYQVIIARQILERCNIGAIEVRLQHGREDGDNLTEFVLDARSADFPL